MNYKFRAVIHLIIEVSDDEFKLIWDNCKHHYDGTIRSLVEVGGFIYGYKNRRDFSNAEDKEMELTQRQLGLVMKSIENDNSDAAVELSNFLWRKVSELQLTYVQVNDSLNIIKS